ncbi:TIGR02530 family flagellar biosynthesis protein [Parasporobacterium paucivorans]|uniref:Flagellar operon protein n=1 Tax=Parasporobacterium paucivorans DSM 15970 TaxID=1122934 RepID=A0A1M6I8G8_9FIRM|nr:TIGR02530 family flagellar biosynthesis protein [Parasporobacterium paucivorans]SHJ30676.1 flagellar operon protein [Parasporobacterium paucivorans DSM 15970]
MIRNINPVNSAGQLQREIATNRAGQNFADILKGKLDEASGLQFSRHAAQRVEQRGMEITDSLLWNLSGAVEKARSKGARDVAVIGDSGAFIVNVPNNVVVTAMDREEMKDNIFTNIDSAVII